MFAGLGDRPWMYFVHSLHGVPSDPADVAATCDYGGHGQRRVPHATTCSPTQFHPEKSASAGLALLGNFVTVSRGAGVGVTAELYPAIDLRGGKAVRLHQGNYDDETIYGDDPVAIAVSFADAGARVDPRRRPRRGPQRRSRQPPAWWRPSPGPSPAGHWCRPAAECARSPTRTRSPQPVWRVSSWGRPPCSRRSSSPPSPASSPSPSGSIIDEASWRCTDGRAASGVQVGDVLGRYPTAAAFVITDIARDGTLEGPDIDGLAVAAAATDVPVIASGGVGTLADVITLGRDRRARRSDHRQGALRAAVHRRRGARSTAGGAGDEGGAGHPVPRRDRWTRRQGRQLRRAARCR